MAKTILGVDIGYDNLKLALIRDTEVKKTVAVPMPKNMVRDGKVVSGEAMAELIRDTMKENGIRTNDAAFVIPNERSYVKTVTLPVMTADQLAYNLPFEFRDYITGEIRDFLFDYAMISGPGEEQKKKSFLSSIFGGGGGKNKDKKGGKAGKKEKKESSPDENGQDDFSQGGSAFGASQSSFGGGFGNSPSGGAGQEEGEDGKKESNQMELLAVSVPRAEIDQARDIFRKAGLKLTKAAPSLCAYINLIRLFEKNSGKESGEGGYEEYCILDLGYQSIRLHMFRGDRHMVTRVLDIGLSSLDSVITEAYGTDIHLAHTYILTNYDNCQEREECIQAYDNIAMELMRVMNFYRYSNPDSNITDIWLCGGGASIAPLREAIGGTLGLDAHPAADLIPGGEEIEDANSFVQAIGVAIG